MSYDLEIYSGRSATSAEIVAAIEELPDLEVELGSGSFTVVRGARRSPCFTIDGPFAVEPEDVPDTIAAAMHRPTHLCSVAVGGSTVANVQHALRLARKLTGRLEGAFLDVQKDTVWPRTSRRTLARPARDARIEEVSLHWYLQPASVGADIAAIYLSTARTFLPEALPRRFGAFEPFQGRLADHGDQAFIDGWTTENMSFFLAGNLPCLGGAIDGLKSTEKRPVWTMSLGFLAEPLKSSNWREAVRQFFIALADRTGAFYASAEVLGGVHWNGRTVGYDSKSEPPSLPMSSEGWLGLPPYPVWWSYYGAPYWDVVPDADVAINEPTASGVFHARSVRPASRAALLDPLVSRVRIRRQITPWVDPTLVSTFAPNPTNSYIPPLHRAERIPDELR